MKKLIAVIAIAMVFALSLSATNLTYEINRAKSLRESNNKKGVMLSAFDDSGRTDFVLYETPKIDLNVINFSLVINNKQPPTSLHSIPGCLNPATMQSTQ